MAFGPEDIARNREYFKAKLSAMKQKADLVHKVQEGRGDFLLVDVRGRDAYRKAHVPGAWCVPVSELQARAAELPKARELVVYCWNHF